MASAGGSDATNALREAVEQFGAMAGRQTAWLLALTWTVAILGLVMAIGVGVQIYITATSVQPSAAWVLWQAQGAGARASVTPSAWTPLGGHETRKACAQVMNRLGGSAKGESHMMCLPDTVDPRAAKVK
jgi:hypothetical protein